MTAPPKVVAVVSAKAVRGYPYLVAAVYELTPRKGDGVLTYRKSYATPYPRRSERLAVQDAQEASQRLGIPLWRYVRHGMTADEAIRLHAEAFGT